MNLPRLDNLPKNADREGVRNKMIEAMVKLDMDCDYNTMVEHYHDLLEQEYMAFHDKDLQDMYDTCFEDYEEDEEEEEEGV